MDKGDGRERKEKLEIETRRGRSLYQGVKDTHGCQDSLTDVAAILRHEKKREAKGGGRDPSCRCWGRGAWKCRDQISRAKISTLLQSVISLL